MRTLLLLIFLTVALRTQAQTGVYHPFPDSDAVWNIDYEIYDNSMYCLSCHPDFQYSYLITGDTVVGSYIYHKIFIPYVNTTYNCNNNNYGGTTGYKGCFRQNIALKKVFYIPPLDSVEYLLYDFNMQVGDTIRGFLLNGCSPWQTPIVTEIDSILIGSNYRKRWLLNGMPHLIEGIGSTDGLIEEDGLCDRPSSFAPSLMCYTQNGTILYSVPPISFCSPMTCTLISSVADKGSKNILTTIFPNPFHTTATLEIKNKEFSNAELKIYDRMGRLVQTVTPLLWRGAGGEAIIHRNLLSEGIYFYQVVSDGGQMVNGKFVVE